MLRYFRSGPLRQAQGKTLRQAQGKYPEPKIPQRFLEYIEETNRAVLNSLQYSLDAWQSRLAIFDGWGTRQTQKPPNIIFEFHLDFLNFPNQWLTPLLILGDLVLQAGGESLILT